MQHTPAARQPLPAEHPARHATGGRHHSRERTGGAAHKFRERVTRAVRLYGELTSRTAQHLRTPVKVITPGQPIGAGPYPPRPDPWSTGVSATEAESWTTGSMSIIGPPPAARPSWWRLAQVGGLVAGWTLVIGAASLASPVDWLHRAALFAHLVFLAIGFGAMLAVGVNAVAVLLRWVRVGRVVTLALSLDPLIWLGLAGISVTGILLAPDLGRPWTWVKLCAVLVVALNGLWTRDLTLELRRLPARAGRGALSAGLLRRAVRVSAVSQLGWWVAVIIGFTSTNG